MKKVLDTEKITNELRGASVFFPAQNSQAEPSMVSPTQEEIKVRSDHQAEAHEETEVEARSALGAVTPSRRHAVMPSRSHAVTPAQVQEHLLIDRHKWGAERAVAALKLIGSEKGTMRLTSEERGKLKSTAFNYQTSGVNLSENEILRIALNYLLEEDEYPGSHSRLDQIITELKKKP